MTSAFDPDSFLDTEVTEAMATEYVPIPEMDAAMAMIKPGSVKARQITNNETGRVSTLLNIDWIVDEQEARDATQMDEPIARQSIFMDLDESGRLETGEGKNVALGRLRDALGLNEGAFTFRMLDGQTAKIRIKHRFGDEGQIYAEVKGVKSVDAE